MPAAWGMKEGRGIERKREAKGERKREKERGEAVLHAFTHARDAARFTRQETASCVCPVHVVACV